MSRSITRKTTYHPVTGEALTLTESVIVDGICIEESITEYEPETTASKPAKRKRKKASAETRAKIAEAVRAAKARKFVKEVPDD